MGAPRVLASIAPVDVNPLSTARVQNQTVASLESQLESARGAKEAAISAVEEARSECDALSERVATLQTEYETIVAELLRVRELKVWPGLALAR